MIRVKVSCINWDHPNPEAPHAHLAAYDPTGTVVAAGFFPTWRAAMDRADQLLNQWRRR